MNPFYHFIKEYHVLAVIECAIQTEQTTLNFTNYDINHLPDLISNCKNLMKLYLHRNHVKEVSGY